jgi:hypothetical protein
MTLLHHVARNATSLLLNSLRLTYLGFMVCVVIPLILGLIFDFLIILPIRSIGPVAVSFIGLLSHPFTTEQAELGETVWGFGVEATPLLFLAQDWAVGVIHMKLLWRLVMLGDAVGLAAAALANNRGPEVGRGPPGGADIRQIPAAGIVPPNQPEGEDENERELNAVDRPPRAEAAPIQGNADLAFLNLPRFRLPRFRSALRHIFQVQPQRQQRVGNAIGAARGVPVRPRNVWTTLTSIDIGLFTSEILLPIGFYGAVVMMLPLATATLLTEGLRFFLAPSPLTSVADREHEMGQLPLSSHSHFFPLAYSFVYHYFFFFFFGFLGFWEFGIRRGWQFLNRLAEHIREEEYLVGRELHNLEETEREQLLVRDRGVQVARNRDPEAVDEPPIGEVDLNGAEPDNHLPREAVDDQRPDALVEQ